ncbi:glycosyltransferase [Sphingosinicella rhizophila]|uniref:Glycosyltransferase family 4 protein n=1 Tax=Sphingosinicella rhizophila TaxID=3050082 RepID=A0ABU3Q4C1_9SPHN|nr:glycosyltransferase family 4 protein [Sphingosinicella sp. GR2756]MDT9598261.1 glycosyltransferase family 4 protein [Sphingosinicella sp. GR2756]
MTDLCVRTRRVLLVSPVSPWPPDSGGAQRTALLHQALARDSSVDLYLLEPMAPEVIEALGPGLIGTFGRNGVLRRAFLRLAGTVSPFLREALPDRRLAAEIAAKIKAGGHQAVVLRYGSTACRLRDLRRLCPNVEILVDVDDFLTQLVEPAESKVGPNPLARLLRQLFAAPVIERRERQALLAADGLWINGWTPAWLNESPGVRAVPLPNIPFHTLEEANIPLSPAATEFLGVAQFRYSPNAEGFDWFLREVWPLILAAAPDSRLRLVGRLPHQPFLERWRNIRGVELAGPVDELSAAYARAGIAIAPIRRGGGTKIKVIEALAMGLPCVCSPHAARGLDRLTGLVVADSPDGFARSCLKLARNEALRRELGESGRRDVERQHSRAVFLAGVRRLLCGEEAA